MPHIMKKRLAQWFLLIAKRLDPQADIENVPEVIDYEPQKLGLTYVITKKDVKEFRRKDGARMSQREGERGIVNEARKNIRKHIIACMDANRLIEYKVKKEDGGFRVSGEMKVYVAKPKEAEEVR